MKLRPNPAFIIDKMASLQEAYGNMFSQNPVIRCETCGNTHFQVTYDGGTKQICEKCGRIYVCSSTLRQGNQTLLWPFHSH